MVEWYNASVFSVGTLLLNSKKKQSNREICIEISICGMLINLYCGNTKTRVLRLEL
jgi:hypothetical protein